MAEANHGIDVGLAALCRIARPHQTLTSLEISKVCGCERSRIDQIARSGLKKLKRNLKKEDYL